MYKLQVKLLLLISAFLISFASPAQKKCCDDANCSEKASEYAKRITGLVYYLGKCFEGDPVETKHKNDSVLNKLKIEYRNVYDDFIRTTKIIAKEYIDKPQLEGSQVCFLNVLPKGTGSNVMAWINFIRDSKPVFPSTEFCGGWKKRFEIGQGASDFLNKTNMSYLGSIKGFLVYTFNKKDACEGNFRLMAGPGYHLRSTNSYLTLSSRFSVRIIDLKASVFSLGNLNFFGGYNTNFNKFSYVESGLEIELGWLGFNLSGNYNTVSNNGGFLAGVVFANKKIGKK